MSIATSRPISELMEQHVFAIDMDDTLADVQALFARKAITWAPVLDAGRQAIGVISASDLVRLHGQWPDPQAVHAWQLCTYKPITVSVSASLHEVAQQMVERKVHHVVVTDAEGVAGVVSSLDFVRLFLRG